jgi:hypothetical protein
MTATPIRLALFAAAVLAAGVACAGDPVSPGAGPTPETPRNQFDFNLLPTTPVGLTDGPGALLSPRFSDRSLDAVSPRRRGLLSLDWQHALTDAQSLGVSAQYGDYGYGDIETPSAGSARAAALSWSALLGGDARLSGQLFLGDESARESATGLLPRRYYGLLLEGRYALGREHAPFASLRWQRSDIDNGDSSTSDWRRESESRFAAGWNWQIRSDWGLRAEASYRFLEDAPEVTDADRTRFGVSTQYGFR